MVWAWPLGPENILCAVEQWSTFVGRLAPASPPVVCIGRATSGVEWSGTWNLGTWHSRITRASLALQAHTQSHTLETRSLLFFGSAAVRSQFA